MPQDSTTLAASNLVVSNAVESALRRQDVPIANEDVAAATPKVTNQVLRALDTSPSVAVVPTVSPWTDKINVTQTITATIALLVGLGVPISDEVKVSILTLVATLSPMLTVLFKTLYDKAITRTSK